jgi:hypothetical protein
MEFHDNHVCVEHLSGPVLLNCLVQNGVNFFHVPNSQIEPH